MSKAVGQDEKTLQQELWDVEKQIKDLLALKQTIDLQFRQYLEARNSALRVAVECKQLADQLERKLVEVRVMSERVLDTANQATAFADRMDRSTNFATAIKGLLGNIDTAETSYNEVVRRATDMTIQKERTKKTTGDVGSVA